MNEPTWEEIKNYLLKHESCKIVHKMVWHDHAWLTNKYGQRIKVTAKTHTLTEVKALVRTITETNYPNFKSQW